MGAGGRRLGWRRGKGFSSERTIGISADGTRVIIGAQGKDRNGAESGHACVYQDADVTWVQVGEDLDGEAGEDRSGVSVGISADGTRIIIGADGNDGNGAASGHARVYQDADGT